MPSYVIVGASRGIGYSFLDVLAKDPANTVFGLVRNVEPTQKQVEADGLKNVTILHADLTDYNSLLAAADKVSSVVGGSGVDYLWLNGAYISMVTAERFLDEFSPDEYSQLLDELQTSWTTNVVGTINAINAFLPLVQKSSIKKVVAISTGMADNSLISKCGIWEGAPYSISKAALNTVIAKYDARFRSQGLLFLALSPGMVDTGGKCTFALSRCSPSRPKPP